jgi:hypothetical protein
MPNSAVKTFHFGADFVEALEDLIEQYLVLTAVVELLRGTAEEAGIAEFRIADDLRRADLALTRMIRKLPNLS